MLVFKGTLSYLLKVTSLSYVIFVENVILRKHIFFFHLLKVTSLSDVIFVENVTLRKHISFFHNLAGLSDEIFAENRVVLIYR